MKSLSVRVIAPSLLMVGAVLSPVLAWSMDEMTDSQLSTTTGQDGITVLIGLPTLTASDKAAGFVGTAAVAAVVGPPAVPAVPASANYETFNALTQKNGLKIGAVLLHDKDGLGASSTYNKGGALIFGDASQSNSTNAVGVQMGFYASAPIAITLDASGNGLAVAATAGGRPVNGTAPVLNIGISLPADLLIRTGDVSVDASNRNSAANPIAVGASGATIANALIGGTAGKAVKIMNSMDVSFGGQAIAFNVQLGSTPQGGMISFGTLKISTINFSSLSLASPNGSGVSASQLSMTPTITDLDLTGLTIDVVKNVGTALGGTPANGLQSQGGLLFSDNSFTVGGIQLTNVTAGQSGLSNANFGGMQNAPMGSFGITNMNVTNLKVGVSGM